MSILPLTGARVEAHAGGMTNNLLLRSAPHGNRPWDRFLARVRAPSLDRQLAAGSPPGSSRALAIRARRILSPAGRRELARGWDHVLDLARRPPVPRTPRGPLCRSRIAAAEGDVREMLTVLTGAPPRSPPAARRWPAFSSPTARARCTAVALPLTWALRCGRRRDR